MKKGGKKKKRTSGLGKVKQFVQPSWGLLIVLGVMGIILVLLGSYSVQNSRDYTKNYYRAQTLLDDGQYEAAYGLFKRSDSQEGEKTMAFYVDYARAAYYVGDSTRASELADKAKALKEQNVDNPELDAMLMTINNIQAGRE